MKTSAEEGVTDNFPTLAQASHPSSLVLALSTISIILQDEKKNQTTKTPYCFITWATPSQAFCILNYF